MFAIKPSSVVLTDNFTSTDDLSTAECSVVLVRDGQPIGRFNVPNEAKGSSLIRLCFAPREFTGLLHSLGKEGDTIVEMIKSDGQSFTYVYRG